MKTGYVITYPECIMAEVEPAIALLRQKTDLKVIALDDLPVETTPDFLVIPGGSCDLAVINKPLHALIQRVNSQNGLLAGICNGALVLASAGVLVGRSVTHTAVPKYAPLPQFKELLEAAEQFFAGSIYVDSDVVHSENILTAKPKASPRFAEEIERFLHL